MRIINDLRFLQNLRGARKGGFISGTDSRGGIYAQRGGRKNGGKRYHWFEMGRVFKIRKSLSGGAGEARRQRRATSRSH